MSSKLTYTGFRNNRKQKIENQVNIFTIRSVSHIESEIENRTKELEEKIKFKVNEENESQEYSSELLNRKKEMKDNARWRSNSQQSQRRNIAVKDYRYNESEF